MSAAGRYLPVVTMSATWRQVTTTEAAREERPACLRADDLDCNVNRP